MPFALRETAQLFCVHEEKHEHRFFFFFFLKPFVVLSFVVDADMIVAILNTSIELFSQLFLILYLLKVMSVSSAGPHSSFNNSNHF